MAIKRTVTRSLAAAVLIMFIVGQGSVLAWFLFYQRDQHEKLLTQKMSSLAQYLAREARDPLAGGDVAGLENLLGGLSLFDGVVSAGVVDDQGAVVAEKVFAPQEEGGGLGNPLYIPATSDLTVNVNGGSYKLGQINLSYSGRGVNDYMFRMAILAAAVEGIVLLLTAFGTFLYVRGAVGRPLGLIGRRVEEASEGDLDVEIPDYGSNEIGAVSRGVNLLLKELRESISSINRAVESLVMPMVRMSTIFENVNREIKEQFASTAGIANSLKKLSDSEAGIIEGAEKLSELSSDNVSFLLEVKSTSEEIVSNANRLFDAADVSYSVVAEISQTSKTATQYSLDVLADVEETLASIEELRASVKEVKANAKESAELAARVKAMAAENGTLMVAEAIDGMEKISGRVEQTVDIVDRLGARSTDVQKMLSVIQEVTEQTNLLSLNAAILAEQAGEHGKGFAVVSEEMRALSDRTAASTKEIGGVVRTIQSEIRDAVVTIREGMEMVKEGRGLVHRVGESMGQILDAAHKSSKMADTIEHATREQSASLDLVTKQMSAISSMASKMSSIMTEQQSGSEQMLERVGEVKEIAEVTKRSTEEQASGTAVMSRNIEFANSRISEINGAALDQRSVTEGIVSSLNAIKNRGETVLKHVDSMSEPLENLANELDALKKATGSFKVR
ncbi:MAG: methyl-accepting chemotaxis protein [Nitrospirota bacterium]